MTIEQLRAGEPGREASAHLEGIREAGSFATAWQHSAGLVHERPHHDLPGRAAPRCIMGRCCPGFSAAHGYGRSLAISTMRAARGSRLSDSRTVLRCLRRLTGTG